MSTGKIPILREDARCTTTARMRVSGAIDIQALLAAIAAATKPHGKFSARGLSLEATGGRNADLIRDIKRKGTAPNLIDTMGLAATMGRDLSDFVPFPAQEGLPSEEALSKIVEIVLRNERVAPVGEARLRAYGKLAHSLIAMIQEDPLIEDEPEAFDRAVSLSFRLANLQKPSPGG